jgi:photosystem II stability/assembly factor-like uncharacterized protein
MLRWIRIFFIGLFIFVIDPVPVLAQNDIWITHGPFGGDVKALILDRANTSVVYAGLEAKGIWKSVDGGQNWFSANEGLGDLHIVALGQDPHDANLLYAGTRTGIFKSGDAGTSWQLADSLNTEVRAFAFDLDLTNHLYCATKLGLYESGDAGESWQPVTSDSLDSVDLYALLVDASDSTIYVGTYKSGVFRKGPRDAVWQEVNTGLVNGSADNLKISDLVIQSAANREILAATRGGGVFRTTNRGDEWISISSNNGMYHKYILDVAVDPYNSNVVYAVSNREGVFKSTDGGGTWKTTVAGLSIKALNCIKISPSQPSLLFTGSGGGVFFSSNSGAQWNDANNGMLGLEITALLCDLFSENLVYAGTSKGGVLKSVDGGESWTYLNDGLSSLGIMDLAADPAAAGTIYAGVWESGVYKLAAGSSKWSEIGLDDTEIRDLTIDAVNPAVMYVATSDSGLFKTGNRGQSWSALGLTDLDPRAVAIDPAIPNVVYAGTKKAGVQKSFNGGQDWFASASGITTSEIRLLAVDKTNSQKLYAATWGGGLYRTVDEGVSWEVVNNGLSDKYIKSLVADPNNPLLLYVGTNSGGVFKSTDGGELWTFLMNGLEDNFVPALAVDPFRTYVLYAGTSAGVHKMAQTFSRVQKNANATQPGIFALGQNYPNPFNPSTLIDFVIGKTGFVTITVYDLLGKEVTELISSPLDAGSYKIVWDGRDNTGRAVAGGVYFYQMKSGAFHSTRKMIFSK